MERETLNIEGAIVRFQNFSGREDRFNAAGDRNFTVVIDNADVAQQLADDGWNIKLSKPRDEDAEPERRLPVKVSYKIRPPRVFIVDRNGNIKQELFEDTVGCLDSLDIIQADLIINPSRWEVNGATGIKAYLKTGYFMVNDDPFEGKYSRD